MYICTCSFDYCVNVQKKNNQFSVFLYIFSFSTVLFRVLTVVYPDMVPETGMVSVILLSFTMLFITLSFATKHLFPVEYKNKEIEFSFFHLNAHQSFEVIPHCLLVNILTPI